MSVAVVHVLLFFAVFVAMEGVAYLMHRYLMHGPMWFLHESHHRPRESAVFELNDLFGIFFALPSMVLIHYGVQGRPGLLAVGLGMTAYGAAYFLFHDVLVHQRVRWRYYPKSEYLQHLVKTHLVHHKTTTKEGAVAFGFLWAPRRPGSSRAA